MYEQLEFDLELPRINDVLTDRQTDRQTDSRRRWRRRLKNPNAL